MAAGELQKVVLTVIEIIKSSRGFQISYYRVVVRCKIGNIEKGLKTGHLWSRIGM